MCYSFVPILVGEHAMIGNSSAYPKVHDLLNGGL